MRYSWNDFGKFTDEQGYEVESTIVFNNGYRETIKTMVVCDGKYEAMQYVREWILSQREFHNVREVVEQTAIGHTVLVTKE